MIPKTSEIHWALCVPSSCSHNEVEDVLRQMLTDFIDDTSIIMTVEVRENMCQIKDTEWTSKIENGTMISM